jgi:hypothetical protein
VETENPAIVWRKFGEGEVIWVAGPLEMVGEERHREFFLRLIRSLVGDDFSFEIDAPKVVEMTMFKQEEGYIINLLNFQSELPNIPVFDIKVRIRKDGKAFKKALMLPEEVDLQIKEKKGFWEIEVPRLDTFLMIRII